VSRRGDALAARRAAQRASAGAALCAVLALPCAAWAPGHAQDVPSPTDAPTPQAATPALTSQAAAPRPPTPTRPAAPPPPAAGPGDVPAALAEVAAAARTRPLEARVDALTRALLGAPYALDPAGEGEAPDAHPPGRYDAFDCLTFVEEVLSLALAPHAAGAGAWRRDLRYDGEEPAYAHRLHHMELGWLPAAVRRGVLQPVPSLVTAGAPVLPTARTRPIDTADWAQWSGRTALKLADEALPTGVASLAVYSLDDVRAAAQASTLPTPALFAVVRADRPSVPLWTTHVGLVVAGPAGPELRHASSGNVVHRVTSVPVTAYIDRLTTWRGWPVDGVALWTLHDPGPARAGVSPR
jgi:hypothetical protein